MKNLPLSLLTTVQIVEKYPWLTMNMLRWILFQRVTNGFDRAVIKRAGRLLIDEEKFLEWIDEGREVSATQGRK